MAQEIQASRLPADEHARRTRDMLQDGMVTQWIFAIDQLDNVAERAPVSSDSAAAQDMAERLARLGIEAIDDTTDARLLQRFGGSPSPLERLVELGPLYQDYRYRSPMDFMLYAPHPTTGRMRFAQPHTQDLDIEGRAVLGDQRVRLPRQVLVDFSYDQELAQRPGVGLVCPPIDDEIAAVAAALRQEGFTPTVTAEVLANRFGLSWAEAEERALRVSVLALDTWG